jgi:hypothetical protein
VAECEIQQGLFIFSAPNYLPNSLNEAQCFHLWEIKYQDIMLYFLQKTYHLTLYYSFLRPCFVLYFCSFSCCDLTRNFQISPHLEMINKCSNIRTNSNETILTKIHMNVINCLEFWLFCNESSVLGMYIKWQCLGFITRHLDSVLLKWSILGHLCCCLKESHSILCTRYCQHSQNKHNTRKVVSYCILLEYRKKALECSQTASCMLMFENILTW